MSALAGIRVLDVSQFESGLNRCRPIRKQVDALEFAQSVGWKCPM